MRIRSTKPEFWRSKTIAALSWDVRLVLKGLESYVDDNGVGKDDIALIAADVFPRDLSASPRETLGRLSEAISILADGGLIARYELDGEDLLYVDRWKELQRIDKPAKGRHRRPDGTLEYVEEVARESYRSPRETVASPPEQVAPGTVEQGNSGSEEQEPLSPTGVDGPTDPLPGFDAFWDAYAKKQGRKDAEGKYRLALRKPGITPELLTRAATEYVTYEREHNEGGRFVMDASRWLHGEHWLDERKTPRLAPVSNVSAHLKLAAELAERERGPQPPRQIGQRP